MSEKTAVNQYSNQFGFNYTEVNGSVPRNIKYNEQNVNILKYTNSAEVKYAFQRGLDISIDYTSEYYYETQYFPEGNKVNSEVTTRINKITLSHAYYKTLVFRIVNIGVSNQIEASEKKYISTIDRTTYPVVETFTDWVKHSVFTGNSIIIKSYLYAYDEDDNFLGEFELLNIVESTGPEPCTHCASCNTGCNECSSTCNGACNSCTSTCNTTCNGCTSTCDGACNSCTSTCNGTCNSCSSTCNGACNSCSSSCNTSCNSCSSTCNGTCNTGCNTSCNSCSSSCNTTCNSCSSTCNTSCNSCSSTCNTSCNSCSSTCNTSCNGCTSTCNTTCNSCSSSCNSSCNSCSSTCNGTCNSCSSTCNTSCNGCTSTCNTSCNGTNNEIDNTCTYCSGNSNADVLRYGVGYTFTDYEGNTHVVTEENVRHAQEIADCADSGNSHLREWYNGTCYVEDTATCRTAQDAPLDPSEVTITCTSDTTTSCNYQGCNSGTTTGCGTCTSTCNGTCNSGNNVCYETIND